MADLNTRCFIFSILLMINLSFAALPNAIDGSQSIDNMKVQLPSHYKCHHCEPPHCDDPSIDEYCSGALYCFKSSVRVADGTLQHSRGCYKQFEHYLLICKTNLPSMSKIHGGSLNVECCEGDVCNNGTFPELPPVVAMAIEPVASHTWKLWVTLTLAIVAMAAVTGMIIFILRRSHRLRVSRSALQKLRLSSNYYPSNTFSTQVTSAYYEGAEGSQTTNGVLAVPCGDSTLRALLDGSNSSGSGGGLPLMVQRTLARQLALVHRVGNGRFGEVWRALWYSDSVAVKIFFSRDEASWQRETEIYSTVLLRHDNILAYIGSDMISKNGCTQLWLITHYHPLGSLHDYLSCNSTTAQQMMIMMLSIVNGILHLHTEIHGTQGKPAIAHRDIKSKNILVKSDGTCCVADLGLAISPSHVTSATAAAPLPLSGLTTHARQGTARYMSPEQLDHSMDVHCFESYRRADVYSLALVLWELWNVTRGEEYCVPYSVWCERDPSVEHMNKIVCVDGARPVTTRCNDKTMDSLASLMEECWHAQPSVRLPVLRIKKTLLKIAKQNVNIHLDDDGEVSV